MGYSVDARMVRVDFFKLSGTYYTTEAVKYTFDMLEGGVASFKISVLKHLERPSVTPSNPYKYRMTNMWALCIDEQLTFPQMIQIPAVQR